MTDAELRTVLARWYDVREYAGLHVFAGRAEYVQEYRDSYILRDGYTFTEAIEEVRDSIARITLNYPLRPRATQWSHYPAKPPTTPATPN